METDIIITKSGLLPVPFHLLIAFSSLSFSRWIWIYQQRKAWFRQQRSPNLITPHLTRLRKGFKAFSRQTPTSDSSSQISSLSSFIRKNTPWRFRRACHPHLDASSKHEHFEKKQNCDEATILYYYNCTVTLPNRATMDRCIADYPSESNDQSCISILSSIAAIPEWTHC